MRHKKGQGFAWKWKVIMEIWLVLFLCALPIIFPSNEQESEETIATLIEESQNKIERQEKQEEQILEAEEEDSLSERMLGEVEWDVAVENARKRKGISTGDDFRKDVLKTFSEEKLKDYDYLVSHFYHVDATTQLLRRRMKFKKLFEWDLSIKKKKEPVLLIYHTHSQEGYKASANSHGKTVVDVGNELTRLLEEKYGISVLHHKGEYDKNSRDTAYSKALPAIEKILKENPSIEVVIDLHRDGVGENTRLVTEVDDKKMAQIMFFNGVSRSKVRGELDYIHNDNLQENLAFSLQMQLAARTYFPTFTRDNYIKGYRYNMHVKGKTLLVEVGAQTNTFEEAKNAMEPLAFLLSKILINE